MATLRVFDYGYSGKEKKEHGARTLYQIDRDRIIHSSSFRRLRNKTQVFGVFTLDYYRTRLTHSLEVSQIARTIASNLNKQYGLAIDLDLIEAISLAHDIGHPPFGHLGEQILNKRLKELTEGRLGFEANAQNIRILTFLEKKFYDTSKNKLYGINPSLKTIDGILKYKLPYSQSDKMKHFIYDRDMFLLERIHGSDFTDFIRDGRNLSLINNDGRVKDKFFESTRCLECQVLNVADDIAYATHDLEDGVESKLIDIRGEFKVKQFLKQEGYHADKTRKIEMEINSFFGGLKDIFRELDEGNYTNKGMPHIKIKTDLKEFFSKYISRFVLNIGAEERKKLLEKDPFCRKIPLDFGNNSYASHIVLKNAAGLEIKALKQIAYRLVMENIGIVLNRYNAENMLEKLYNVFSDERNLRMYPDDFQELYNSGFYEEFGKDGFYMMCSDYMSGMTDMYAIKLYSSLFEAKNFAEPPF